MTTYLSRSAWTSTAAAGATLTGSELVGVAVHWPGTTQATIGAASQSSIANRLRSYRTYHVNTRGWSDIGYNLAIDQAGRVWMLRSTQWRGNRVGAHAASGSNPRANRKYVGVLLLLGASESPSAAMIAAFRDWYHNRFLPGWPGRTDVRGHGQVPGASTSCPGSRARNAISSMTRKPSSGSTPTPPSPGDPLMAISGNESQVLAKIADAVLDRVLDKVDPNSGSTPRMRVKNMLRHAHYRGNQISVHQLPEMVATQERIESKVEALLGGGHDEVLSRIAANHAETLAALTASAERETAQLELIEEALSGERDASDTLRALRDLIDTAVGDGADPDDDGEA